MKAFTFILKLVGIVVLFCGLFYIAAWLAVIFDVVLPDWSFNESSSFGEPGGLSLLLSIIIVGSLVWVLYKKASKHRQR